MRHRIAKVGDSEILGELNHQLIKDEGHRNSMTISELRRLELVEMDAAAAVHRAAFDDRLPWLTGLHTPEEDRSYFRGQLYRICEIWGAFEDATLVGHPRL
jgi:hypothetical protein